MQRLTDSIPILKKFSYDSSSKKEDSSSHVEPTKQASATLHSTFSGDTIPSQSSRNLPPRPVLSPEQKAGRPQLMLPESFMTSQRMMNANSASNSVQEKESPSLRPSNSCDNSHRSDVSNTLTSSVYMSPPSSPSNTLQMQLSFQADDMNDVLIQRYMQEKHKFRMSEGQNQVLKSHIVELNKHIDDKEVELDAVKNEQQNIVQGCEQDMKSLQDKIELLEKEMKEKELEYQDEKEDMKKRADEDLSHVEKEAQEALQELRQKLAKVQTEYRSTEALLQEETEKLNAKIQEIETGKSQLQDKVQELEEQSKAAAALEERLLDIQQEKENLKQSSDDQIAQLKQALKNVNEMLTDEDDRAKDFCKELKLMSSQYVESVHKLEAEQDKNVKLMRELDEVDAKLKDQLVENVSNVNKLEELARGYIDIDELLKEETESVHHLQALVEELQKELTEERKTSETLSEELKKVNVVLSEKTNETLKLTGQVSTLETDIDAVKNTLTKVLKKVKTLTKKREEAESKCEQLETDLNTQKESVQSLTSQLGESQNAREALNETLGKVNVLLTETKDKLSSVQQQLEEKNAAFDELQEKYNVESQENEAKAEIDKEKIAHMEKELEKLTQKYNLHIEVIQELEKNLEEINNTSGSMDKELVEKTELVKKLQVALDEEKTSNKDDSDYHTETIDTLKKELTALEDKHTRLFDNLVETESTLHGTKDLLERAIADMAIRTKEYHEACDELQARLDEKETFVEEMKEANAFLSKQLNDTKIFCNTLQENLSEAEGKTSKLQEEKHGIEEKLAAKEKECANINGELEKEKNGVVQRKLKVAKKMIHAEKKRYRAILKEVEAKDLIISRVEKQAEQYLQALETVKTTLEDERIKNKSHSTQALQELHRELETERKAVKADKEELRSKLQKEKATVKALTTRINALEGSANGREKSASVALKKQHEMNEMVKELQDQNESLSKQLAVKDQKEKEMNDKMSSMETKIAELTKQLDTMTEFCNNLEEEKKVLTSHVASRRLPKTPEDSFLTSEASVDSERDDEDTVDNRSLSDFSLAQIPAPRQTQSAYLLKKTRIEERVCEEDEEDVELTVDATILYGE